MPAGRVPGMFSAPRFRSRQPIARTTARAVISVRPFSSLTAVRCFIPSPSASRERTIVEVRAGISSSAAFFANRAAYSGPESSSPNRWMPKPLWMHWRRMPPSSGSRSRIRISRGAMPFSAAATAAASPAGPPPMMTSSRVIFSFIWKPLS